MDAQSQNPLQAGEGLLTLDAAVGLLSGRDDEQNSQSRAPSHEPERGAAAQDRHTFQKDDAAAASAGEDPRSSGDSDDADRAEPTLGPEPEGAAIEPPASWKAADKAMFRTLPREVQQVIADRERMREQTTNRALQETAAWRKAVEAERKAVEAERQHYAQQLAAMLPALHKQVAGEFADIRTHADAIALAQSDPARYARWKASQDALQSAVVEAQRVATQQREQRAAQLRRMVASEREALVGRRPDLQDKAALARFHGDLRDYAISVGFAPEQYDGNLSHLNLLVLEKAMLYDRAQRARSEAIARPVPKVQWPGAAQSRADRTAEDRAARLKRLEKTGRVEDAVGLLRL